MSNINFSQFLTKKFTGLNANNVLSSGNLTFGSLTQMNQYTSLFDMSSINLQNGVDYSSIIDALKNGSLEGLEGENQNVAAMANELLAMEEITKIADLDGNGEISAEELQALMELIAKADGENGTLSAEDVDAIMEQLGVNLEEAVETAINEVLAEAGIESPDVQSVQPSSASVPSSNAHSGGYYPSTTVLTPAETAEQIKQQITEKEGEIDKIEEDADKQIEEKEKEKDAVMEKAGLTEEEINAYKEQEQKIEDDIKGKESDIKEKDSEINDFESSIESNENYIKNIDAQIEQNQSKLDGLDENDEKTPSRRTDFQEKINRLNEEKKTKERENETLRTKLEQAENDKKQLEKDKANLETEKQQLNASTMKNAGIASQKGGLMEEYTAELNSIDKDIADIRTEKTEKINEINGEIKDLQVKLKDTEAAEERKTFLDENKAKTGFGISGEEFAQYAIAVANDMHSTGWCATGVHRAVLDAFGISMGGNGCDWDTNMDKLVEMGYFEDATDQFTSPDQLVNLPAGAVVVWENNESHPYGHVSIATGDGHECSDHYQNQITRYGTPYHVYFIVD